VIQLENITKSYQDKLLFKEISYHFPKNEKIALIGDNGAGKTTLLDIITGRESADDGAIVIPRDVRMGLLDQHLETTKDQIVVEEIVSSHNIIQPIFKKLSAIRITVASDCSSQNLQKLADLESAFEQKGGYKLEAKARSILTGLGFSQAAQESSVNVLSGGWKMRLAFAKMFINEPNFIVLDEPTNHLDLPSLVWFENFLSTYRGTVLLVSHDREFINRFSTITLHLVAGKLNQYVGNYDAFIKTRDTRVGTEANTKKNLLKKKEQLDSFISRFGAKSSKATQAKSKEKSRDKIQDSINAIDIEEETKSIRLPKFTVPHSHKTLLETKQATIGYTKPLLENISLQIKKHQKIAIIGANGIGKSTLLACFCAKKNLLSGGIDISQSTQLAFFSQDIIAQFDKNISLLECLMTHTNIGQAEARSILGGLLFSNNTVQKPLKVLSGGELNRLGLAYVLAKKPNLLFLDEPTNHLDIKSAQVLSQYLREYKGTLVFVSHNRRFIDELATHVLACSKHHSTEIIEGNLEDYKSYCLQHKLQSVLEENIVKKISSAKKSTNSYSEQKKKKKSIEAAKRQIKRTEQRLGELVVEEKELEKKLQDLVFTKKFAEVIEVQKTISALNKERDSLELNLLELLEQEGK
jgi:ATP-binding cassette, subfamily F, member 3